MKIIEETKKDYGSKSGMIFEGRKINQNGLWDWIKKELINGTELSDQDLTKRFFIEEKNTTESWVENDMDYLSGLIRGAISGIKYLNSWINVYGKNSIKIKKVKGKSKGVYMLINKKANTSTIQIKKSSGVTWNGNLISDMSIDHISNTINHLNQQYKNKNYVIPNTGYTVQETLDALNAQLRQIR